LANKACISPNGTRQVNLELVSHYQVTSEGSLDLDCSKLFTWHTRRQHRRLCSTVTCLLCSCSGFPILIRGCAGWTTRGCPQRPPLLPCDQPPPLLPLGRGPSSSLRPRLLCELDVVEAVARRGAASGGWAEGELVRRFGCFIGFQKPIPW